MTDNTLLKTGGLKFKSSRATLHLPDKKKLFYIFVHLMCALTSFLSAGSKVFKFCSPFSLAFCAALPGSYMPTAVLGSALGYFLQSYEIVPLRYVCALLLSIVLKKLFFTVKFDNLPAFSALTALLSCSVTGILTSLILDETEITLLLYVFESFVCAISAFFWAQGVSIISSMKSLKRLSDNELVCLMLSLFLIILSFGYIDIKGVSPAAILSVIIILAGAYYAKAPGGAITGVLSGAVIGMLYSDAYLFALFAFAGLLAGISAPFSRVLSAAAVIVSGGVFALITRGINVNKEVFIALSAGVVLFLIIPKKVWDKLAFLQGQTYSVSVRSMRNHAVNRLRFASDAMYEVGNGVSEIHGKLDKYTSRKKSDICKRVIADTCSECGMKHYCWEHERKYHTNIFKKTVLMLENGEELTKESLPCGFGKSCIKSGKLIKNFSLAYENYVTNLLAGERAKELRSVMTVQFGALARLLRDLSDDIENKEISDSALSEAVTDALDEYGADFETATVILDENFRTKISVRAYGTDEKFFEPELVKELGKICSRRLDLPRVISTDNAVLVNYLEQAPLKADIGFCRVNADGGSVCGDSFESLKDSRGRSVAIISDGMGSGIGAGINGAMAAGIIKRLVCAGVSPEAAIKTANAALMVKSADESFASIDMAAINLYNGKTDFYKAGATCSFIKRRTGVSRVELSGLPIGILGEADCAHTSVTLSAGDILLMVSDGATQGNFNWINALLEAYKGSSPSELANMVAAQAQNHQFGAHSDDITSAAIIIKEND